MPDRRVPPHDREGRPAFGRLQLPARDARGVAEGAEDLPRPERREAGEARRRIPGHRSPVALDGPEERRHPLHRLRRRIRVVDVLEESQERFRRPLRRQP